MMCRTTFKFLNRAIFSVRRMHNKSFWKSNRVGISDHVLAIRAKTRHVDKQIQ